MKKWLALLMTALLCVVVSLALTACGDMGHTESCAISSASMTRTDNHFYVKVPHTTTEFSFYEDITVPQGATYLVARDKYCENVLHAKNAPLEYGDNYYYILVTNGNKMQLYTVTVRRLPLYTVRFVTDDGTMIASQSVEEGTLVNAPDVSSNSGYIFLGWYHGNTLLSTEKEYSFEISSDMDIKARFASIEEIANFNFTSTATTFVITGVKDTTVTSITIPDYVTSIGERAFEGCANLTSVTIPDSVTSIGERAFYGCRSLTSITIPDSVTLIGSYAFSGCSSLTSIEIGNGVTSISSYAFAYCSSLTSIVFTDTSIWYRTTSSYQWENKTDGTYTPVTDASQNATHFASTYDNFYWYKK